MTKPNEEITSVGDDCDACNGWGFFIDNEGYRYFCNDCNASPAMTTQPTDARVIGDADDKQPNGETMTDITRSDVATGDQRPPLAGRVRRFADLKKGWDSYGSDPFPPKTIERAALVAELLEASISACPASDGSIVFEWHGADGKFMSLAVFVDDLEFYARSPSGSMLTNYSEPGSPVAEKLSNEAAVVHPLQPPGSSLVEAGADGVPSKELVRWIKDNVPLYFNYGNKGVAYTWNPEALAVDFLAFAPLPISATAPVGWRLIDSAPKDGKDILIYARGLRHIAFWDEARCGQWSIWPGRELAHPTHWQPLPAPPLAASPSTEEVR